MKSLLTAVVLIPIHFLSWSQSARIGINTSMPQAGVHIKDSTVLFSGAATLPGTPGSPPASGNGIRTFWYPDKAAFRTGRVTGTEWDKANIGNYSFAAGLNNTALGQYTFATGQNNKANADLSFAIGSGNKAGASQSFVSGVNNIANGPTTFVVGRFNDSIQAPSNTITATSPLFLVGNGANGTNRTNALTVLFNGNVGIGPTSIPTNRLHVTSSISGQNGHTQGVLIENTHTTTGEAALAFKNKNTGTSKWIVGLDENPKLSFNYGTTFTSAGAKMTIDSMGRTGIGTASPHSSALLDVTSPDKGVLVPRIALTAANVASPVTSPANALLIYNTATSGAGDNAVAPGFYFWSTATNRWTSMNEEHSTSNGFGEWNDCGGSVYSHFNPAAAEVTPVGVFGYSVSLDASFAIIGAPQDSVGSLGYAGSAWIFRQEGSTWSPFQELTAADAEAFSFFGVSVDIWGNYAVIGVVGDNENGLEDVGSAYVFHFNGSAWVQQAKLVPNDADEFFLFGYSVAIDSHRIAVGAPYSEVGGTTKGAVYVFQRNGSSWTQQQKLIASDGQAADQFGRSVDIRDNIILAGAPDFDIPGNSNAGSAYFFTHNGSTWNELHRVAPDGVGMNSQFGMSVSLGDNKAVIGAPRQEVNGNFEQGTAHAYQWNGSAWVWKQKLFYPAGAPGDLFGSSVCITDGYIAAGNPKADPDGMLQRGSATFFADLGSSWRRISPQLTEPSGETDDLFGTSVSIQGDQFLIGAPTMFQSGLAFFGKIK